MKSWLAKGMLPFWRQLLRMDMRNDVKPRCQLVTYKAHYEYEMLRSILEIIVLWCKSFRDARLCHYSS